MGIFCTSSPSFVFGACAALLLLRVVGVGAYSNGAPPESCDDMLPEHTHLGRPVANYSCDPACPVLEVVGFEGHNTFSYTCGMAYTLTASVTSIMVEAREASNSFDSSMPHVGTFSLDGSSELKIICDGNAVTQTRVVIAASLSFTWIAPDIVNAKSVRFWYTVVPAPAAFYAQLLGPVGEPDPSSCSCRENEFIYIPPGSPDSNATCQSCPMNSSSSAGRFRVCGCVNGTGRISEALGMLNATEPCSTCPGAPTNPSLQVATPPNVVVGWSAPPISADWPLKYQVKWPNGTVIADGLNSTSVMIQGVAHLTEYTVNILTITNTSCVDAGLMYTFTTEERCPSIPPQFSGSPNISIGAVGLLWDPPPIEDPLITELRYALYLTCEGETVPTLEVFDLQRPSYTIHGLPAATQCTVQVVVYSSLCERNINGSLVDSVMFITATEAPSEAPRELSTPVIGATTVQLSWQPPPPSAQNGIIINYVIQYSRVDRSTYSTASTNNTELVITGLHPYANYSFAVAAATSAGLGPYSDAIIAETLESAPATPPQSISALVLNSTSVRLSWEPPSLEDQNGVIIFYTVNVSSTSAGYMMISATTDTELVVSGLNAFTWYNFTTAAGTSAGRGPFSDPVQRMTLEGTPSAPTNFSVTAQTDTTLVVSFSSPSEINGILRLFQIQHQLSEVDSEVETLNITVANESTPYQVLLSNLDAFTMYAVRMRAATGAGFGPFTLFIIRSTLEAAPSPPVSITVSRVNSTSLYVTWGVPELPRGIIEFYQVDYSSVCSATTRMNTTANSTHTYLSGLSPFTEYTVRVRAFTVEFGNFSVERTRLTSEAVPAAAPLLNITSITASSIAVAWQPLPPCQENGVITSYTIAYRMEGGVDMTFSELVVPAASSTALVSRLTPYTNYTIKMAASTSAGRGEFGPEVAVLTSEAAPSEPQSLLVVNVTSVSITLAWQPPAIPNGVITSYSAWYTETLVCNGSQVNNSTRMILPASATVFTFTALEEDTPYVFYVSAETSAGEGMAAMAMATTMEDVPSAVPAFTITSVSAVSFTLSWRPPPPCEQNGNITGYTISVTMEGMSFTERNASVNVMSIVISSLNPFTTYGVKMAASTVIGQGIFSSEVAFRTDESEPSKPQSITTGAITSTEATLTWQPPAVPNGVITAYNVWYNVSLNCSGALVSYNASVGPSYREYHFTALEEDTPYVFYVSAETSAGEGMAAMTMATTMEDVPSAAPAVNIYLTTATNVTVAWESLPPCQENGVITSYTIAYRMEGGVDMTFTELVVPAANSTATVSQLTPYTNYTFKMAASTSAGRGVFGREVAVLTSEAAPSAPLNLNFPPGGVLNDSITLTWSTPQHPNGVVRFYQVQFVEAEPLLISPGDGGISVTTAANTTTIVLSDLTPGTQYTFSVRAFTVAFGPFSDQLTLHTAEAPSVPQSVRTLSTGSTTVLVTWTGPAVSFPNDNSLTTYEVRYRGVDSPNDVDESFNRAVTVSAGMQLSYNISDLMAHSAYNVSVRATNQYGVGDFSEEVTVRTGEGVPSAPLNVTLRGSTSTFLRISWSTPSFSNGANLTYCVEYTGVATENAVNDSFSTPNFLESSTTSVTISGLVPFSTYTIGVRASTSAGAGPTASLNANTTESAPSAPLNLTFPPGGVLNDSISLTWLPPQHPNGVVRLYHLRWSSSGVSFFVDTTTTTIVLSDLTPGTQYTFLVRAFTVAFGPFGAQLTLHTADVPTVPQAVSALSTGSTTMLVTWTGPAVSFPHDNSLTTYEVQYRGVDSPNDVDDMFYEAVTVYAGMELSYRISGLMAYSAYNVSVRATNQYGVGDFSEKVTARTEEGIPSVPLNVTLRGSTPTSLQISWSTPSFSNGANLTYRVEYTGVATENAVNDSFSTPNFLESSSTSVTISGLVPFSTYTIGVSASTSAGAGPTASINAMTATAAPSAPLNLNFPPGGVLNDSITLTWLPPQHPNGVVRLYQVQFVEAEPLLILSGDGNIFVNTADNTTMAVLSDLTPGTQYTFSVRAFTVAFGPFSEQLSLHTADVPSVPQGVIALSTGSTTVLVTWMEPAVYFPHDNSLTTYEVQYRGVDTPNDVDETFYSTVTISAGMELSYNIPGLMPYSAYNVSVRATNQYGVGDFSEEVAVRTEEGIPSVPLNVTLRGSTPTFLQISWSTPSFSNGANLTYRVEYTGLATENAVNDSFSTPKFLESSTTSVTISGLVPFSTYTIGVSASTSAGAGPAASINAMTAAAAPSAPLNLMFPPGGVLNVSITLTWLPPQHPSGVVRFYELQLSSLGFYVNTTNTTIVLSDLTPGTQYTFSVRAFTVAFGPFSAQLTLHTADVPAVPQGVTASGSGSTVVVMTWREPAVFYPHDNSQTTYEVQYRGVDTPNDVDETFYSTVTVSARMELSYTISGLDAYSAYNVSVRATNQYGVGDFSEEVTVRTEEGVPSAPLNVTLRGSTPTSLQVSWSTPSFSNGANLIYRVEYTGLATQNAVNDSFSTPSFLESSTTSVTISGLVPFSTYTIGVSASTSAGAGPTASINATTTESAPSAPLNLNFPRGGVLNDSITLTWLPPQHPNGVVRHYQLQWLSSNGDVFNNTAYDTTVMLSDLTPGTRYNVSVRAFTVAFGPFSDPLLIHTADVPLVPQSISTLSTGPTTVLVTWMAPTVIFPHNNDQTTYEVQYRGVDSPNDVNDTFYEAVTVSAGMTLNLSISDLMAYSAYNVSVRATNQYGVGDFSEEVTVRTEEGVPSAPLNVTLRGSTSTSLQISWTMPSFSNGANLIYRVEYTGVATENAVNDSFSTPNFLESSTTSVTISGLVPFSTYTIGVRASTSAGAGPTAFINATTTESAPSAPLNLTFPPGGVLNDSVTLTWLPPQHPNGVVRFYFLRWSSFGVNFIMNTTDTTIVLSDLTLGTQYTFSVRAFTVAFGPFSDQLTLHTADVPSVPQGVIALSTGSTTVLATWREPVVYFPHDNIRTTYEVRYRGVDTPNDVDEAFYGQVTVLVGSALSQAISGLVAYSAYNVSVRATNQYGVGDFSEKVSVRTEEGIPSAPLNVTLRGSTSTSLQILWSTPSFSNGANLTYRVEYTGMATENAVNDSFSTPNFLESSTTSVTISGLVLFSTYTIGVSAGTSAGAGPTASINAMTTAAAPSAPLNLTFPPGGVLNDSITLTWLPPQHPNGVVLLYQVQLLSSDGEVFMNTTDYTTTAKLSDLTPGTQYAVSVRAFTVAFGPFSDPVITNTADVPSVPQGVSALSTGSTTVMVTWMEPVVSFPHDNSQTTYEVWFRGVNSPNAVDESFFEVVTVAPRMTLSVTLSGLLPYSAYNVSVRAANQYGVGDFSEEVTVRTEEGVPSAPLNVTLRGSTSTSLQISWSTPSFSNGANLLYHVEYTGLATENAVNDSFSTPNFLVSSTTSVTISGLVPFSTYTIGVSASTSAGAGPTASINATTAAAAPSAPLNLVFPPGGVLNDSITLTWLPPQHPNGVVRHYQLQLLSFNGDVFNNTVDDTTIVLSDLTPGTQYTFLVRAFTVAFGPFSEPLITNTADVPSVPQGVSAFSTGSTTVLVTWMEPAVYFPHDNSLTTYEVQYRGVNTPNDVDESFFQVVTIAPRVTLSVTISGLLPYSAYNVSVRATNQYGVGDFSEEVTVRTEDGIPSVPLNVTLHGSTPTSLEISWSTPSFSNGANLVYRVEYTGVATENAVNDSFSTPNFLESSTTSVTISGLVPFSTYTIGVSASTSAGAGPTASINATTATAAPSQPETLTITFINATTVSVVWDPPLSPNGIILNYTVDIALHVPESLPFITSISADTNETLGGLEPATTYTVAVRGMTSAGTGEAATVIVTTLPLTPDGSVLVMPQNVSVSDGQSVTFMCVVDLAGSYVVQWSHNGEVLPGENQSLLTVSAVTAAQGGTYTCLVVNEVGSGMDEGRLYVNAFFLEHPASAVISVGESATLSCSAVGFPDPNISWIKDEGVVEESVGIEISTSSYGIQTQSVLTITSASVNLTGVYLCLSITNIEGFPPELVESNPARLTVQDSPEQPTLTVVQTNTTSIFLLWEEPADNNAPILMYQIALQVVGDESGNTSVFTSVTTELTVTGLTPFTVYSVQVVAVNSIGSSPPSPLRTVMTAEGIPSAPLELRVTDHGSFEFNLEWNPPSSPNGIIDFYQVKLFTENSLDLPALNAVNVNSTSYNFTDLAPFTGYSVQVCAYTVGCGDVASLNVTTLGVAPVVAPSDGVSNKPISMGDPVTISFTLVNDPVPIVTRERIQWVFSGIGGAVNLSCTSNSKYSFSDNCLSLTVSNAEGSDAGQYQIVITTEAGIEMGAVGISVSGVKPSLFPPLMDATLPQGGTHMFVCTAVADPFPFFTFRFNGERVTSNTSERILVTSSTSATLTLYNLQREDEGTYNCSVSNRYGSVSTAAVLSVQVPPTITFSPSAVRDVVSGETLTASCDASADPAPVIQWFKGDRQLKDGDPDGVSISQQTEGTTANSRITVMAFTSEDAGVYSCVAVNDLGRDSTSFQVNSVVRSNITGIRSSVNGSVGTALFHEGMLSLTEFTPQLELTCEAYGIPSPDVVWLRNGVALQNLPGRRVITVEDGGPFGKLGNLTRSTLTLSEVQLSDAGEYTCRATSGNVSPIPGTTAWIFTFHVIELNECDPNPCLNNGTCVDGVRNYTCNCASVLEDNVRNFFSGRNCSTKVDNRAQPSITTSPSSTIVQLHDRIALTCSATGNPTPSIAWYKDGKQIKGPQANGDVFVIPEATPNERGFYHCEAFSSFGDPAKSKVARILIEGIVQFRIRIIFETGDSSGKKKRQATTNNDILENLRLQIVNQALAVEGNYTATVYSVEPAGDNSSDIVITVATDSSESPATLTDQLTGPLEQTLEEVTDINEEIAFIIVDTERHDGCPKLLGSVCGNVGSVTWPETEIGEIASVPCRCGIKDPLIQQLKGTRRCGGTYEGGAMWEEPQCDSCIFTETRRELCALAEVDSPAQLASVLVGITDSDEIESEDVSLTVGLLDTVAQSTEDLQQEDVQKDVLSIVNNVQQVPVEELTASQNETDTSTRVLAIVDEVLNVVEVAPDKPFEFASTQFAVRVEDPPADLGEEETFTPNIAALLTQIMRSNGGNKEEETPEVPPAEVALSSTLLRPKENESQPRLSTSLFITDKLFQERANIARNGRPAARFVGSIILDIAVRVDRKVRNVEGSYRSNLVQPEFTKTSLAQESGTNPKCQFWNFSKDGGFGAWDDRNCRVLTDTTEKVTCGCDHLTHFAILLDFNPNPPTEPPPVALALTGVSYIGTTLSILSLTITIITYLGERDMRKTVHSKLLLNLCFALVGLYVTFIISTVSTGVPVLCGVVSALMHYFFLAVFFWMAAEAIHLHRKLVSVLKPDIKDYVFIAMAICWVVPVFIVVFSLAPRYQNYVHPQFCRVYDYSFWIGLLIPFGIIYIMNWIIFILIFGSVLCRSGVKGTTSGEKLRKLKENFMIALGLSILFGVGWAVGLLASSDIPPAVRYPAEWIFTLVTAFLGVYLFLLYVLRSAEGRGVWKRWLLCQSKRKRGVSFTSSTRRSRLSTLTHTLSRRIKVRRDTVNDSGNTSTIRDDSRIAAIAMSGPQTLQDNLQPLNFEMIEKMKPEEWYYSEAFSHESSTFLSAGNEGVTSEEAAEKPSGQYATAVLPSTEEPNDEIDTNDLCCTKVHPSYQVHADNVSPESNALPTQTAPTLSSAEGECYIVENKEPDGTEITPL